MMGGGGGGGGGGAEEEEEDEFTVFDTWDENNKPTNATRGGKGGGKGGKGKASSGEGLTWDQERQVWERQSRSSFGGNPFASKSPFSWDLRASTFKSPASLMRIRAQAEKVFDDAVSNSIFTSPSMQRFKQQTDSMIANVQSTFTDITSTLFSWFR